ncbi:MAG: hypothetical protein ACU0DW_08670 [Shimia sp.]
MALRFLAATTAILVTVVTGAQAGGASKSGGAQALLCYTKVNVPDRFEMTKKLVTPARQMWVQRKDQLQLVEVPAIYEEVRTLAERAHVVLRETPCITG